MGDAGWQKNRRILIIDDNEEIHNDFRRILSAKDAPSELDDIEAELFPDVPSRTPVTFELAGAHQGAEGLSMVRRARERGAPFAMAFTDVRMPPGWDGIETLSHIWQEDPNLQAVICSAYSDYSWGDIVARIGQTDNLLILSKPFDPIEVRQMAFALTEKWNQRRALKESHQRLSVQYAASRILVESATIAEGMPALLGVIGRTFCFAFGAVWLADGTKGALRCEHTWSESPAVLDNLQATTLEATCAPGQGWPGLALARGGPSFIADIGVAEDDARAPFAARASLRSAIEFPLTWKGANRVAGVLEFMGRDPHAPDPELFEVMTEIGAKIGHFIERKRVEAALRQSEAKSQALLNAVPDTILRVDEGGTCLDFKASKESAPFLRPDDIVNKSIALVFPEEVAQELMHHVSQALREHTTQVFEYQQSIDGDMRSYEARVAGSEQAAAMVIVRDITEQKRAQAEAEAQRAREEAIRTQNEMLAALATPLIPISDTIIVMPLVGTLDAARVQHIRERLIQGIAARKARIAILDTTGVPSLNAEAADELVRSAQAARLLGSEVIITGLRPDVAQTLVQLGADLRGIATQRTLQSGIALAMKQG
jgi:PAS domain S-box-containing protein